MTDEERKRLIIRREVLFLQIYGVGFMKRSEEERKAIAKEHRDIKQELRDG